MKKNKFIVTFIVIILSMAMISSLTGCGSKGNSTFMGEWKASRNEQKFSFEEIKRGNESGHVWYSSTEWGGTSFEGEYYVNDETKEIEIYITTGEKITFRYEFDENDALVLLDSTSEFNEISSKEVLDEGEYFYKVEVGDSAYQNIDDSDTNSVENAVAEENKISTEQHAFTYMLEYNSDGTLELESLLDNYYALKSVLEKNFEYSFTESWLESMNFPYKKPLYDDAVIVSPIMSYLVHVAGMNSFDLVLEKGEAYYSIEGVKCGDSIDGAISIFEKNHWDLIDNDDNTVKMAKDSKNIILDLSEDGRYINTITFYSSIDEENQKELQDFEIIYPQKIAGESVANQEASKNIIDLGNIYEDFDNLKNIVSNNYQATAEEKEALYEELELSDDEIENTDFVVMDSQQSFLYQWKDKQDLEEGDYYQGVALRQSDLIYSVYGVYCGQSIFEAAEKLKLQGWQQINETMFANQELGGGIEIEKMDDNITIEEIMCSFYVK